MGALIISLTACLAFALFQERSHVLARKIIMLLTLSLEAEVREDRRMQLVADNHEVQGSMWKLIHALDCVRLFHLEILSHLPFLKVRPRYTVIDFAGENCFQRWIFTSNGLLEFGTTLKAAANEIIAENNLAGEEGFAATGSPNGIEIMTKHGDQDLVLKNTRIFHTISQPPDISSAKLGLDDEAFIVTLQFCGEGEREVTL